MWFYAKDGRKVGPVSDGELDSLAANGILDASTLVWKEGMAEWLQLATARPDVAIPKAGQEACSQCGNFHSPEDLVALSGLKICAACKATAVQHIKEGLRLTGNVTAWRHGKRVVALNETALPHRCIKCNQPANTEPRKVRISPSASFRLEIRTSYLNVYLCEIHQRRYRLMGICGWLLVLSSLISFVAGIGLDTWALFVTSFVSLVSGILLVSEPTPARATRGKDQFIWIAGSGSEFRNSLPEWTE